MFTPRFTHNCKSHVDQHCLLVVKKTNVFVSQVVSVSHSTS